MYKPVLNYLWVNISDYLLIRNGEGSQAYSDLRYSRCQHNKYNLINVGTYLLVERTHSCDCLNKIFFSDLASFDLTTEGAKWALIRSLLAKIAAYLFIHAFIIMNLRIFTGKPSPATVEDPNSIKLVNRIISNTIEQSIIFVSLYAYFIFDRAGKSLIM